MGRASDRALPAEPFPRFWFHPFNHLFPGEKKKKKKKKKKHHKKKKINKKTKKNRKKKKQKLQH
eukprot:NODE_12261_length_1236_cov_2.583408.p4 GENE.NODE_12261_length_1236_cov_2.583408~~NODE_12261_length_1236_cov_2.583408.p4  ORF type:complete len:64 (-),score=42.58 NODE_12261_length_1236_cov_2.583408:70-261(-)